MSNRQITIYSGGGSTRTMNSEKTTWGELKTELTTLGVSLNNITALVGETEVSLESAGAQLPEGEFTLFLLPVNVKSGNNQEEGPSGPSSSPSLLERFMQMSQQAIPDSYTEEEEPYEESYEESYDEPKAEADDFEEKSIIIKLEIIKEIVKEIEEYFHKKSILTKDPEIEKYHKKAEELKKKLFL